MSAFFHAELGLNVCPRVNNQPSVTLYRSGPVTIRQLSIHGCYRISFVWLDGCYCTIVQLWSLQLAFQNSMINWNHTFATNRRASHFALLQFIFYAHSDIWLTLMVKGGEIQLPLKRLPDSSVSSLIQAGWGQERHLAAKNLF